MKKRKRICGKTREAVNQAAMRWGLVDSEYRQVCAYLRGPQICRVYDALPSVVRQVVDEITQQLRRSEHAGR